MKTHILTIASIAGLLIGAVPGADAREAQFGVRAEAGYFYDSNVGIADIDSISGNTDSATKLGIGIDARFPIAQYATIQFGYDYDDTAWETQDAFDLGLHHAGASLNYSRWGIESSIAADRYVAMLDDENYLSLTHLSPSVSKLFGSSLFVRLAYTRAAKEYDDLNERSADNDAVRADIYWLLDGMKRYIAFGFQDSREDARDDELDYDGFRSMLTIGQTFSLSRMQLKLKSELRYETRRFLNVTESIDELRRDDRLRLALIAAIPLTQRVEIKGEVEHTNNASNLESANHDRLAYGLSLTASF